MTRRTQPVENMLMTRAKTVEKQLGNIYFFGRSEATRQRGRCLRVGLRLIYSG